MFGGANLTGISQGIFNSVHLIDESGESSTEIRELFLTGSVKQSIPSSPATTDVLSLPGLVTQLNLKANDAEVYSIAEVNNLISNNPGPTGPAGANGSTGPAGRAGATGRSMWSGRHVL